MSIGKKSLRASQVAGAQADLLPLYFVASEGSRSAAISPGFFPCSVSVRVCRSGLPSNAKYGYVQSLSLAQNPPDSKMSFLPEMYNLGHYFNLGNSRPCAPALIAPPKRPSGRCGASLASLSAHSVFAAKPLPDARFSCSGCVPTAGLSVARAFTARGFCFPFKLD